MAKISTAMAISMFKTSNTNQETEHCFLCFRDTLDIEFISITVCSLIEKLAGRLTVTYVGPFSVLPLEY